MIVFALFMPMIFIILAAMAELTIHQIKVHQASTLTRELALMAYEGCLGVERGELYGCLEDVRSEVYDTMMETMPDLPMRGTLILSVYGSTGGTGKIVLGGTTFKRFEIVGQDAPDMVTQYTASDLEPLYNDGHKFIVVAELFYDYDPVFNLGGILPGLPSPGMMYESSVI